MTRKPPTRRILKKEDGLIDWGRPARRNSQSVPRFFALAGSLYHISRTDVAHLEVKTC